MRRPKCTICGREVKLDQGRKLTVKQFKKNGDKEDTICNPCRTSFYNTNIQLKLTKQYLLQYIITMMKFKIRNSHSVCVVCKVRNKPLVCTINQGWWLVKVQAGGVARTKWCARQNQAKGLGPPQGTQWIQVKALVEVQWAEPPGLWCFLWTKSC